MKNITRDKMKQQIIDDLTPIAESIIKAWCDGSDIDDASVDEVKYDVENGESYLKFYTDSSLHAGVMNFVWDEDWEENEADKQVMENWVAKDDGNYIVGIDEDTDNNYYVYFGVKEEHKNLFKVLYNSEVKKIDNNQN